PECGTVRVGLQLCDFGDEFDRFKQVVNADALRGRYRNREHVAAIVLDHEVVLGELLLYAVGIGAGNVDLVDGHDHRDVCRLHVRDRLDRLRHHAVIGGDDKDGEVRHLGAAGAHRCE